MIIRVSKIALTHAVSPAMGNCELTHQARVPIDFDLARAQHRAYEQALRDAGYLVDHLEGGVDQPDSVFVEDIAVVFDELAVIARPGAPSRRPEVTSVTRALDRLRKLHFIVPPGTLDGGDVLVVGTRVFVGISTRTNHDAAIQMHQILSPHGYEIREVVVHGCLHLKSAVTALTDDLLLVNSAWIDTTQLPGFRFLEVDPAEPSGANALRLDDRILYSSAFPRTAERIRQAGLRVHTIDASEVAKAEGAVTCCSLLVSNS
ncbi:MAG: dimethylargininase [Acidobacteria bacterium]|nr:dimethylargininase [Acidobacteriota bacterium]